MRNPRPCRFCDLAEDEHEAHDKIYFPKPRTEPLRVPDTFVSVRWLRNFLDAEEKSAEDERSGDAPPVEKAFWDGVHAGLATVRGQFCDS